jgi:hypothetical protein
VISRIARGAADAPVPGMQFDELENEPRVKRTDKSAMRILKDYVAQHDGEQPTGVVVDREFVVVEPDPESGKP